MHISIPVDDTMELIDATEISPLISHCNVKVCYVGPEPNRNGTVITKEVAEDIGKKLPGSPIVGYYNEGEGDYEGHNRSIEIGGGKFNIIDMTKPYGFVPTDAKVWFQKFVDDNQDEREYLVTECYLWTTAYPEVKRVLDGNNNQSMELNDEGTSGAWTKGDNISDKFFIYNEALIEKLCILGENVEPCFEGAQFKTQFSLADDPEFQEFRLKVFSMMEELQNALKEGGKNSMVETYAVEIGSALWNLVYDYLLTNYPDRNERWRSEYHIYGIYEEDGQKFVILTHDGESKLYRLDITYTETDFSVASEMTEVAISFTSTFEAKDVEDFEKEYASKKEQEEEAPKEEEDKDEKEEPKKEYNLDEIPEYVELNNKYTALQSEYEALKVAKEDLDIEMASLKEFKVSADRKEKQSMIDSFYMLSDEDKQDVITNIDAYSLDDIEAKLSVICFRNKVAFNVEGEEDKPNGLFNLNIENNDNDAPEWVLAVHENERM